MRKLILFALLVSLLAVLAGLTTVDSASAKGSDVHYWQVAGRHPLDVDGRSERAIDCAVKGLTMSVHDASEFRRLVAAGPGKTMILADETRLTRMTFEGCKTVDNLVVKWGPNAPYDRHAEAIAITEADGTVKTYVRPFVCNNWSLLAVVVPPKIHCYIVRFDYRSNTQVMAAGNLKTAAQLVASGLWHGSADQAYLNESTEFAFVLAHLDFVDDAERQRFADDECTGIVDETGMHHEIEWNCDACLRGTWPPPAMIDALMGERGARLPERKPNGAFRFPVAGGHGYFSMPLWAANRWMLFCVEVPEYYVRLEGFTDWTDSDNFDVVTAEENAFALSRGKKQGGTVYLNRSLSGRYTY